MKEIFVDINDYNKSFITATESDNNSDVYKIIITEDGRRFDLTEKTVQMAYAISYTDKGDILNLNVTNPTEGEITLEITNELTRKDGDYTCQLLILGENEYRRHSRYYFNLSIRKNLFNKISGEIIESPNIGILQELVKKAEFLNTQLENNNNVAESLNTNLAENIKLADPLNSSLGEKIPEAATKKSELESSITKAKEFIDGLDGSQNIPQLRLDVTELQNGLKSNQALEYSGSSITANNTLEGRTEGMKIGGRTLRNLKLDNQWFKWSEISIYNFADLIKPNTEYILFSNADSNCSIAVFNEDASVSYTPIYYTKNIVKFRTTKEATRKARIFIKNETKGNIDFEKYKKYVLLEADSVNENEMINYFEGIKSFGEAEQEGDKYKIKLLSKNKNFFNKETNLSNWWGSHGELHKGDSSGKKYSILTKAFSGLKYIINVDTPYSFYTFLDDKFNVLGYGEGKNTQAAPVGTTRLLWYLDPGGIDKGLYNKIQVEPGTKSTEYQSYQEDKKDILIPAPLRGFDGVEDVMNENNGQVEVLRRLEQYNFNGNEAITKENTLVNITRFYIDIPVNNIVNTRNLMCNIFNSNGTWWDRDEPGMYWDTTIKGRLWFHIPRTQFSDVESFRNFLKTNQTTIIYQLATPTTEIVESIDIDLGTFQDITYVNIENSLPGALDFKVPSNIGSLVQSNTKEINNINEFINKFVLKALLEINKDLAVIKIKNGLK